MVVDKKILAIAIALFAVFGFFSVGEIKAGAEHNVSGFAWSENIGWISFNNTSGGGTINYGVDIDETTGMFSGYAWSENIGWIDFAPPVPYPANPEYSACLDFSGPGQSCEDLPGNDKVGGWARALAHGDGWDGWIKLRGSNPDYGVDYDKQSGELSGFAWGSDVIGWIKFKDTALYGVVTIAKLPPSVSTPDETWAYCADSRHPILNWTYQDGTQASYWIQIDTSASFLTPEVDTGEIISSSQSYATTYDFNWDTRYRWQVKAKNQQGDWSNWSNTDNFDTPKHAYPWVDFTWIPPEPTQKETVEFTDLTETFGGASIVSRLWTIISGAGVFVDGTTGTSLSPNIQFSTFNNIVRLEITDSDGYSCYEDKDVIVQLPLPEYKEVPPLIRLQKFFLAVLTQTLTHFSKFAILF